MLGNSDRSITVLAGDSASVRVLLCDDHPIFTESLAVVLEQAGIAVVATASSVDQAIAELVRATIEVDVCMLDVYFAVPDQSAAAGLATRCVEVSSIDRVPELKAVAPSTRVLLLSAQLTLDVVARGTAAGIDGFVHKDCRVAEIVNAIHLVNGGKAVHTLREPTVPQRRLDPFQHSAGYLSAREREVLSQLVAGKSTAAMVSELGITWTTARSHIQNVLTKLGAHSRLEAATTAVRDGMVNADTGEWLL